MFAWRLERVAAQVEGVRVPRQVLGRDRHLVGASRRGPRRRLAGALAGVHRGARASASTPSPPRSSRTTGRSSSTTACGMPAASCTTSPPTSGPTSRSATSRRSPSRVPPARRRCRTRSTRSASRTPRRISRSRADCSRPSSQTLVTSRLQRDLTDSTTQRNIGVAFGHSLLALDNLQRGLGEISLAQPVLVADLDANWEVLAEAIQTVVRAEIAAGRSQISDPYALLKDLTRGRRVGGAGARRVRRGPRHRGCREGAPAGAHAGDLHRPRVASSSTSSDVPAGSHRLRAVAGCRGIRICARRLAFTGRRIGGRVARALVGQQHRAVDLSS